MYFESRSLRSLPVADSAAAVREIHAGRVGDTACPTFPNAAGQRIALISDSHIDKPWFEVAVVNLDTREQYDSITFGWIQTEELKLAVVNAAIVLAKPFRRDLVLSVDGAGEDQRARFECGCCGEDFRSTIAEQKKFDQDSGYGICPACVARHGAATFSSSQ